MNELSYGMLVTDAHGFDIGVLVEIPNKQAEPWVDWSCHENCRGHWRAENLRPLVHVLSGEPLFRSALFDVEAVERDEYESRCVV